MSSGTKIFCITDEYMRCNTFIENECLRVYNFSAGSRITFAENDVKMHFCSSSITFANVTVMISDSTDLTIGSGEQKTYIKCRENSGIHLKNVAKVSIVFIELTGCGMELHLGKDQHLVYVAMLIENSSDITLDQVHLTSSYGSGLMMLNVRGNSALTHCYFKNSTSAQRNQPTTYTGALHIQISNLCKQEGILELFVNCENLTVIHDSKISIKGCKFIENHGAGDLRGGGLMVYMFGNSSRNLIVLENCEFTDNSAGKGGGAYIGLQHRIHDNIVEFKNTSFISNSGSSAGGLFAGYYFHDKVPPKNNTIVFLSCKFYGNKANYSGGVDIASSASQNESITENSIEFRDCVWINNSVSLIGAAVGASPMYNNIKSSNSNVISNKVWFAKILFVNSNFLSNFFVINSGSSLQSGILYATIPVWFQGLIKFHNNSGAALDLVSTTANFERASQVEFINNTASQDGSALNLIGFSAIAIKGDSSFTFRNNRACAGAAIQHHSIDPHEFVYAKLCFIRYVGHCLQQSVEKRNISFVFHNNFATCKGFGNSIHASTLFSCNNSFNSSICKPEFSKNSSFNCVANFSFHDENRTEVTTDPIKIAITPSNLNSLYPGKSFSLNIRREDELGNIVPGICYVTVASGDIKLDPVYNYITNNEIRLSGRPESHGMLNIIARSSLRNRIEANVMLSLRQCLPGYVLDITKNVCKCSTFASTSQQYQCIDECNEFSSMAKLLQNWWMNFADINSVADYDEDKLLYGYCPKDHCFNNKTGRLLYKTNKSQTIDDKVMCHPTRTGRLCSQCREPYTAHYHSNSYRCGTKTTCKYGWFLYLISEILPVTCLFIIIALFDIKLTSGVVSGFIYFAQTIDKVLLDDTTSSFGSSMFIKVIVNLYSMIIRIFNLKFIQFDSTSYCLLEGANTLDMIAFQYTTALYSLVLVALIIVAAHYCSGKYFVSTLRKIRTTKLSARSTLLHGITGFLVLSYSGIISTSVNLLLSVSVYSIGHKTNHIAVYFSGNLKSFGREHLPYAIPAILVLSTLGLIPPLLLIAYPLSYRLLALIKLNESKFTHILCTCIPLEKMKPLFDSFQSSLKDEYRFFSGLYFVFRLSTLAIQSTIPASGNTTHFYTAISIQSALIFGVQALCQPYKKRLHNILEAIFFFDLTALTITFAAVNIHTTTSSSIIAVQLILLYLPLLIVAVYAGKAAWYQLKKCTKRKRGEDCDYHEFSDSIIFRESETRSQDQIN